MPAPGDQRRAANAIPNPFDEIPTRISEYTAQEIATLQSRLDKQLGPEYISTRPGAGGGKVHYLAAEKVINLANEVFGFNGWSSCIRDVQIDFVDESATSGRISLGLSIIVRVTLKDGTHHEDIGYGQIENSKSKAAAFEKAKKEAATDALKRALRNFGNVLGNCLYDKDYLQRVNKLKVIPSKWDPENLHRHPSYGLPKNEPAPEEPAARAVDNVAPKTTPRVPSMQSAMSTATDYEDEFGGNLFDGMEFSHPDEVLLEDTTMLDDPPAPPVEQRALNGAVNGQPRQPVPRVQSMPAMRPPNGVQPPQNQHQQQPQGQPVQQRQPQTPIANQAARQNPIQGRIPPPQHQHNNQGTRPPGQPNQPHHNQPNPQHNQHQQQPVQRPNPSSNPETQPQNHPGQQHQHQNGPPHPNGLPPGHEPPVAFISSRAAELLKEKPDANLANLPAFNPHAESPSLRRTSGINHKASAPIRREAVGAPAYPPPPNPGPNAGAPIGRPNFVNPTADANRRIGMPGGGAQSPFRGAGAYKPPGPALKRGPEANRPPLADVSNMQQDGGGGDGVDVKRQRVAGS